MTELQRDKTFEPSGVSGKLKVVLHDVSGTLIRALGTIERRRLRLPRRALHAACGRRFRPAGADRGYGRATQSGYSLSAAGAALQCRQRGEGRAQETGGTSVMETLEPKRKLQLKRIIAMAALALVILVIVQTFVAAKLDEDHGSAFRHVRPSKYTASPKFLQAMTKTAVLSAHPLSGAVSSCPKRRPGSDLHRQNLRHHPARRRAGAGLFYECRPEARHGGSAGRPARGRDRGGVCGCVARRLRRDQGDCGSRGRRHRLFARPLQ